MKHVIGVHTDINNLTNDCTGTGTLKFWVGDGESKDQVIEWLKKVGVET